MKLFTIGPVEMYESTKIEKAKQVPYFRTEEFSNILKNVDRNLKNVIGAKESSKTIYLTASGTAGLEASVINCFTKKDKLLVVNGGTFGQRFSQICDIHEIPHTDIILKFGQILTKEILDKYENQGFTGFLVNLDETSTGQLYDIKLISNFCKRNNLYLIVDAITSFLCDPFDMDEMGIDVTIISSQKGLCLSPGLSCVVLNERIINERVNKIDTKNLYLDFKTYFVDLDRGQTPFTPAVGIIYEMKDILNKIVTFGKDNWINDIEKRALYFRSEIKKIGATIPSYPLSYAITPVIFEKNIAKALFKYLYEKHRIFINPCGGEKAESMIRISHIGNLSFEDYDELINHIKIFLENN